MPRVRLDGVAAFSLGLATAGCVVNERLLEVPETREAVLLLVSTEMPAPIDSISRHAWFAMRRRGESHFSRVEFGGFGSGPFGGVADERLHAAWQGAEAEHAIDCLKEHASEYRRPISDGYLPWPGPNSNTFVDRLLRECNLHADLPATAIGKDYRGVVGVSATSGGTGVQLETPLAGIRLGLTEGVELHLLVFALGIDFWPPALIVPFGSGRLGFDDR
jgi:hypothetical protein